MTVSAIDVLQSSNSSEDRNQRKTQRNDSVEGLFSMLLQKANLQQVASVGMSTKLNFDFTPARSDTQDLPADPPPAERKTDDKDDSAAAAPTQKDDARDDPKTVLDPNLATQLGANNPNAKNAANAQANAGNGAKVAADANADAANAALTAATKPVVEQAAANAQGANNATLKAKVTETPGELVSQPSNTLSGNAAVTAQATKSEGKVDPLAAGGAVEPDESMINSVLSRAPGTVAAQAARQSHNGEAGQPDADAGQDTAPKVNAPVAPQTLVAATAARNAAEPQTAASQSSTGQPLASAQSTGQGTTTQRTADLPAPPRAHPNIPPRVVTDQVAIQIQRAIGQGMDKIQIQLRPPELGRIDVRMEIGSDGHMKAAISADRQETLDLLQRDARHLQQALQDSGLSTDSGSLSFSLNGQANDFREQLSREGADAPTETDESQQAELADKPRGRATDGTYDIEA
ncbi:MAG: flagellar hook-length control protein FliK [Alphaproteobacteria bacterium]